MMQILWTIFGQRPDLAPWEARPVAAGVAEGPRPRDRRDAFERDVAVERPDEPEPGGPFRRAADAVCRFHVFPPRLVTPLLRRAPVQAGNTVGICYHFAAGVDLFFAARVTACFDGLAGGAWKTGFTYRTLHGHPELGEETFIAHNVPSPYRERVIKTFEKHRTPLNISMEMPTLEAIKRMVEDGMGVALVPRLTAQTEIARGLLVGLTVKEMRLERKLHLIYRRGATLSHAAKAFLRVARGARDGNPKRVKQATAT